eukprot:3297869-Rhodomonas_salina.2
MFCSSSRRLSLRKRGLSEFTSCLPFTDEITCAQNHPRASAPGSSEEEEEEEPRVGLEDVCCESPSQT